MTDSEKCDEWVRFIKAQLSQHYKLKVLAGLEKGMRAAVLKKLGAKTAEDLFVATEVD